MECTVQVNSLFPEISIRRGNVSAMSCDYSYKMLAARILQSKNVCRIHNADTVFSLVLDQGREKNGRGRKQ